MPRLSEGELQAEFEDFLALSPVQRQSLVGTQVTHVREEAEIFVEGIYSHFADADNPDPFIHRSSDEALF